MTRIIGLTGGIASGKSTVTALLRERGVTVLDADQAVRDLQRPGEAALRQLVEALGPEILTPDGALDRAALGREVFADPAVRRRVEEIMHPLVRQRLAGEVTAAEARREAIVVQDIPLLFEARDPAEFDATILVYAPPEIQFRRLLELRGMTSEEARARMAAQLPIDRKRGLATWVIENSGSEADLRSAVDRVWGKVQRAPDP